MSISSTGDGLNILIHCNYTNADNWMAFVSWHSIYRNLPEAKVFVACNRTKMQSRLFSWTKRCRVPFELHKTVSLDEWVQHILDKEFLGKPLVIITPDVVAVRDFEESGFDTPLLQGVMQVKEVPDLCCAAKEEKPCVFVTYSEGWGRFVTASWINRLDCPLASGNRFAQGVLTANEVRIGRLWSAVTPLFQTVSGG